MHILTTFILLYQSFQAAQDQAQDLPESRWIREEFCGAAVRRSGSQGLLLPLLRPEKPQFAQRQGFCTSYFEGRQTLPCRRDRALGGLSDFQVANDRARGILRSQKGGKPRVKPVAPFLQIINRRS